MQVGFVGTGNIGNRLAPKLIDAGHALVVNDLRRESAERLIDLGATWAESPRAVAEACDVTFASVPGPADVERLLTQPAGLLEGLSAGKVFVDLTTSYPAMTRKLSALCRERGAEMLDCPVSMGGGVALVVGGDKASFERAKPLLEAMAAHVYYLGESGMGNVAKLVRQYAGFVGFWAQTEALVIAAKAGADVKTVADFMAATGIRQGGNWLDRAFERDFGTVETSSARLDIVAKDVSLAMELARSVGAAAGTGMAADDLMKRGQARGWGRLEFYKCLELLEEIAGAELRG